MKKSIIAAVGSAALLLWSCSNQGDSQIAQGLEETKNIEFMTFGDTAIVELPELGADFNMPFYATIINAGVFPIAVGDSSVTLLQQAIMKCAFNTTAPTVKEAIDYSVTNSSFLEEGQKSKPVVGALKPDSAMSEETCLISIQNMNQYLLSFKIFKTTYMYGAAHGMYGSEYVNFYMPTRKLLTAENVFRNECKQDIINAIREVAVEQTGDDSLIAADSIERYDNFYFSNSGTIVFVYAPYEIACYAEGEISIDVAPDILYDYLTPLGKQALHY